MTSRRCATNRRRPMGQRGRVLPGAPSLSSERGAPPSGAARQKDQDERKLGPKGTRKRKRELVGSGGENGRHYDDGAVRRGGRCWKFLKQQREPRSCCNLGIQMRRRRYGEKEYSAPSPRLQFWPILAGDASRGA